MKSRVWFEEGCVGLPSGNGLVLVSNALQGRIFCRLGSLVVHRADEAAVADLSAPFRNVGGNSLWPGPEGGPFAWNYPRGAAWQVQPDLDRKPTRELDRSLGAVSIGKTISLVNRGGAAAELDFRRRVTTLDAAPVASRYGLEWTAYRTLDELSAAPGQDLPADSVRFCAWSLEQFPAEPGTVAFGRFRRGPARINADYYGDPGARIRISGPCFAFEVGGEKFQIGLPQEGEPELIGALDRERGLLLLRRAWAQEGLYFNIADNDQPGGPASARDAYSLFNGGPLGFYELETIAPLHVAGGRCESSRLWSETLIFRGPEPALLACLGREFGVPPPLLA